MAFSHVAFVICIHKASEKKGNICGFNKFCVFFYSYLFEVSMYIYIYAMFMLYVYAMQYIYT